MKNKIVNNINSNLNFKELEIVSTLLDEDKRQRAFEKEGF